MISDTADERLDFGNKTTHPIFGLEMPVHAPGVPDECLNPRNTWADPAAYDAQAEKLAKQFRQNEARFDISEEVRRAGPRV